MSGWFSKELEGCAHLPSLLPLLTFAEGTNCPIGSHFIRGLCSSRIHQVQQEDRDLPLFCFLASADRAAVNEFIGRNLLGSHFLKKDEGSLPLVCLFTGVNRAAVDKFVSSPIFTLYILYIIEKSKNNLPLTVICTGIDGAAVASLVWKWEASSEVAMQNCQASLPAIHRSVNNTIQDNLLSHHQTLLERLKLPTYGRDAKVGLVNLWTQGATKASRLAWLSSTGRHSEAAGSWACCAKAVAQVTIGQRSFLRSCPRRDRSCSKTQSNS